MRDFVTMRFNQPVRRSRVRLAMGLFAVAAGVLACKAAPEAAKPPVTQQGSAPAPAPDVLAMIGQDKITMADVRERNGELLDQLDLQYKQARDRIIGSALDTIVHQRILANEAKKQGKTPDEVVSAAIAAAGDPSDLEAENWYKDNQARVGNRSLAELKPQILALLQKDRRSEATDKLEARLKAEQNVKVLYEPNRLQFSNDGAPSLGSKQAPVTLVEFSDFQCPYCQAAAPTLKQVHQKYGDKVRIIYRQFPIQSLHPFAPKAAEASLCANEQGKFWELHDQMFQDQTKLSVTDLKEKARRLGLDSRKFNACLDAGKYVEQIQNDQKEGKSVGVTGTPAMFINGVPVDGGSVPFSVLAARIDKELARSGR